jgi:hypothetical protein
MINIQHADGTQRRAFLKYTLPIAACLALAMASVTAHAQTAASPGCVAQKAGEGGDSPVRAQKAGEGGDAPVVAQKAGEGGDAPVVVQKAGEGGDAPVVAQKAGEGGDSPVAVQRAASGGMPCKKG